MTTRRVMRQTKNRATVVQALLTAFRPLAIMRDMSITRMFTRMMHPILTCFRRGAALMALSVLVLLSAACSSDSDANVTYVVITNTPPGSAQAAITPAPTQIPPTPTITPIPATPTPAFPPEVALQVADRDLLDGFYENAVVNYGELIERGDASDEVRAAAALGLAQAALREGLFQAAVDASTTLMERFPQDFRAQQAFFLRGDAYLGLGQWQAAIDDFQQYLVLRPGWIDSYVHERIGDAQINLGQIDAALMSYDAAVAASTEFVPIVRALLHEKMALRYLSAGRVDQAVAQYDAILSFAQNVPYRASIAALAADTQLQAGNTQAALARYANIIEEYTAQSQAYAALTVLTENGFPVDAYLRGRVAFFAEQYNEAIAAFNEYTTEVVLAAIPAELYLLLGQAYRAIENYDAALVAFQTLTSQYPNDPLFGDALLEQGRTRFWAGDTDAAIDYYVSIADDYGYLSETAADALWRAGFLHNQEGRIAESRAIFLRLADAYPQTAGNWAVDGLFIAAEAAIADGDTIGAETLYARIAATAGGSERAEAYLWLGRLALQRGDSAAANSAFASAITAAPASYYAARAVDFQQGRDPFAPPAQMTFSFDDLTDITEAETWLRATFPEIAQVQPDGPLWPLSATLDADPRVVRGRELWALQSFDEATQEFLGVVNAYVRDPLALYQLAVFLRGIGAYDPSIRATANLMALGGVSGPTAPAYIARMAYPAYYRDVVLREANNRGFDPLLMFSLIRHESLFNANATAAAGEKGLTQVIPSTGEYIAGALNWPDYQHSDLFRPYAAVAFGAFYLDEQLQRFDGNTYAALAGYNAGPGRAISWLETSGGDPDRFMASITISTTQLYVQLIYSHYNVYRQLYGA